MQVIDGVRYRDEDVERLAPVVPDEVEGKAADPVVERPANKSAAPRKGAVKSK